MKNGPRIVPIESPILRSSCSVAVFPTTFAIGSTLALLRVLRAAFSGILFVATRPLSSLRVSLSLMIFVVFAASASSRLLAGSQYLSPLHFQIPNARDIPQ